MLAHFQGERVFLAYYQHFPWNQMIKISRWWQNSGWWQQKKVVSQKISLHKDYMVEHSPLFIKLLAIYCMLPTSWCCNPWQRQHSHHRSSKHRALVSVIPKVFLFSSVVVESILYFFNRLIREIIDLIRKTSLNWAPSAFSWLLL